MLILDSTLGILPSWERTHISPSKPSPFEPMMFRTSHERWVPYCWWFRNPQPNQLGCIKPCVNNGISTTNLNWWTQDFWTINSMLVPWKITKTTGMSSSTKVFRDEIFQRRTGDPCLLVGESKRLHNRLVTPYMLVGLGSGNIPLPPKNDFSYAGFRNYSRSHANHAVGESFACILASQPLISHQELAISQRQRYLGSCQTDQQKDFINDFGSRQRLFWTMVHLPGSLCQRSMAAKGRRGPSSRGQACQEG